MCAKVETTPEAVPEFENARRRRDRQALKTAGAGILVQVVGYGVRLAVIPLSLKLLGTEQYGLWLAVGSLIAWGGLADLGLAPGLVNLVAAASGRGDREAMRRYISCAFAAYTVLACGLVVALALLLWWGGLPGLIGARTPALASQSQMLLAVCGAMFVAMSLTRVVPTACVALQEGYYGMWPQVFGSLGGLVLLAPLLWTGGSLLSYALVMGLPPLAGQIGLGAFYFGRRHRDLFPSLRWCDRQGLRALWGLGAPLTLHQVANLAVLYSANVLIANRLGPAAVPQYSVPYALFAVLISAAWYLVSPYLPAYAEAATRMDREWIGRRAVQNLAGTAALMAAGGSFLLLAGPHVIPWWTGGAVSPPVTLLLAVAAFAFFKACTNTNSVLLIGLGLARFAAFVYLGVAAAYVIGAWFLLPRLGLVAVPLAGAVAHAAESGLAIPYAWRRLRSNRWVRGASYLPQAPVEFRPS